MDKAKILGVVRHILTAAGGYAVGQGLLPDAETATAVVGALVTIVGVVWSIVEKQQRDA